MIAGTLCLFGESELDRLHAAVLRVLERTGIRVCNGELLAALARSGANVDGAGQVARFPQHLVEGLIAERRRQPWAPVRERGELERQYKVGLGGAICPFYHDYDRKVRRPCTRQDLLDVVHWAEVDLSPERSVGQAMTLTEVDPRIETVEAYALLLEHTSRPSCPGESIDLAQIPFLLDLATAYYGEPRFPPGPSFMTSPLTIGHRLAAYLVAAARYGVRHFSIGVMPIGGGNAPMTVAGTVVIAVAEALGYALAVKALAPEAAFTVGACNGILDLRRGTPSFNAPEALLSDLGFCELFNRRYGGGANVAAGPDYIDAALPNIQAAYERTFRAMAIAAFVGQPFELGGYGTLDAGQIFSPVQFIIERDMGEGIWRFGQGIEVSAESIGLEAIEAVGAGEGRSFLEAEHTLHHCRETWFPRYLYRGVYGDDATEHGRDRQMLDAANQHYRECIARYQPPTLDEGRRKDIRRIVARARQTLLA